MNIKINHLKSIGTTVDFTLRDINFFVGPNASGKSILPGLIQLFKHNDSLRDFRRRQFPSLSCFDHQEDWGNWAHMGQLDKPTSIVRSVSFLNQKASLKVKIKEAQKSRSNGNDGWKPAQVESFIIQDGQIPLMIWGPEKRRIYTRQWAIYLSKAIKNYGAITPQEWEEELDIPLKQSVHLTLDFFDEYIEFGPEYYEDNEKQLNFFYLDIQALFFRRRLSITNNPAFEPITNLMEKVLLNFQQAMLTFLIDSPVLTGKRKLQWDNQSVEKKNRYANDYFGFSIAEQKKILEDGTFIGRQLLVNHNNRQETLEKCSKGVQVVCSWIEEWAEAVKMLKRQSESLFFSAERVVFIQNPENFLHTDWQIKLLNMILDDVLQHPNWKIVIETHSNELFHELTGNVNTFQLDKNDLAIFEFARNRQGETRVNKISMHRLLKEGKAKEKGFSSGIGQNDIGLMSWN